jgi:eukaryotic-like serine/threonine-protein kinase
VAAAIGTGELLKGRYRLERTLGRGGMAAVWLGHDEVLDRPVAVKVLSDTIAGDPGFVARFRREAQTAAALSHPNLVGVYDYSEEGERPYLVMQFVPGEDLAARLERGEGVDCGQLARELLEALGHIHAAGILHRDVKPANVIVEPGGTAKLIDFGIALPRDATALTSTGLILGTERYAAPEVMEGQAATERSDLYSAGVVLRSCAGQGSSALSSLIEWMTSRDPSARPASARQALVRLERSDGAGEMTQVFEPTFAQPPEEPWLPGYARAGSHRSRFGAVAAILGVLAAVLIVAVTVLSAGGEERGGAHSAKQAKAKKSSAPKPEGKTETTEATVAVQPPAEADPARGAELNEQGYALMQAGEYEAAVPVLEEAVGAFPEGSEDLDYAYALFNLGSALRQSGRAEEAIPILERRLEIPNQTGTVEAELEAARGEVSGGGEEGTGGGEEGD